LTPKSKPANITSYNLHLNIFLTLPMNLAITTNLPCKAVFYLLFVLYPISYHMYTIFTCYVSLPHFTKHAIQQVHVALVRYNLQICENFLNITILEGIEAAYLLVIPKSQTTFFVQIFIVKFRLRGKKL
jgi:hypothetical protein